MNFEEFSDYVDHLCSHVIPPILFNGLNQGVQVSPERMADEEEPEYYIMGEYIQDALGSRIVLYYGTFKYFFKGEAVTLWQDEILATLKHELLHHVEALAGQEDLAHQEELEVLQRRKERSGKPKRR